MAYTTIDESTDYFRIKLYAGNAGANRAITWDETDTNMQPDMLWFKSRTDTQSPCLFDSVRGATLRLIPSSDGAEGTEDTNLDSFDTNGFQVDAEAIVNGSSRNYVTWGWKAGTSFSNDASGTSIGTIDSSGSFNNSAGFSIVLYTANGSSGATIKHGLNQKPGMFIIKSRDAGNEGWMTYHKSYGATKYLRLNEDGALATGTAYFNDTEPTNSVFSIGNNDVVNKSGDDYVAYCFAEKQGYSKFGSYTGNGNADGAFVYTGFKPAFVIVRKTSAGDNWTMADNKRNGYNVNNDVIYSNLTAAEANTNFINLLSNGFKMLRTDGAENGSGASYIYMAFAEQPFVTSTGVPATAR